MSNFNASYSGRICEYEMPPYNKNALFDGSTPGKRYYRLNTKTKNKIKDAFLCMVDKKKEKELLFLTFTYQCPFNTRLTPPTEKGALEKNNKKKAWLDGKISWNQAVTNDDLRRLLKYLRNGKHQKRNPFILNGHCGVMETTKLGRPHYHIMMDLTYKKKLKANHWANHIRYLNKIQRHWNTITGNEWPNSVDWKIIKRKEFKDYQSISKLSWYMSKYVTKGNDQEIKYLKPISFISHQYKTKPIKFSSKDLFYDLCYDLYKNKQDFISKNPNFTESTHFKHDTSVYFVDPHRKVREVDKFYNEIRLINKKSLYLKLRSLKMYSLISENKKKLFSSFVNEKIKIRKDLKAEILAREKKELRKQLEINLKKYKFQEV